MTHQFSALSVCIFIGLLGGVLYDVFFVLKTFFRVRVLCAVCDVLYCLLFGCVYVAVSVACGLPPLRMYFLLGLAVGLLVYLKSFHKIVAFFAEKVYNKLVHKHKGKTKHGRRGKSAKAS